MGVIVVTIPATNTLHTDGGRRSTVQGHYPSHDCASSAVWHCAAGVRGPEEFYEVAHVSDIAV